jgi:hypothetical protein
VPRIELGSDAPHAPILPLNHTPLFYHTFFGREVWQRDLSQIVFYQTLCLNLNQLMKIIKIYDKYKIMPQLQLHMLRVAGVAKLICDNYKEEIDKGPIISACLLHDMGNIIKFDLNKFPEFLKPRGLKYWKNIQQEFKNKYGNDDHEATYKIIEELSIEQKVYEIVLAYGFSKAQDTLEINDYDVKVSAYSDHRVSPSGVRSLEEKLKNSKIRYTEKINSKYSPEGFDKLTSIWQKIEIQIFTHCKIKPDFITEEKVRPVIEELRDFEIQTNE